jgi:hypothetical protein
MKRSNEKLLATSPDIGLLFEGKADNPLGHHKLNQMRENPF